MLLLLLYLACTCATQYDLGLVENEKLLRILCRADNNSGDCDELVQHPVYSFNLIKRAFILSQQQDEDAEDINVELKESVGRITDMDMMGAVKGVLLISHTYDTDVELFRKGEFLFQSGNDTISFKTNSQLRTEDLTLLSETALDMGFVNTAASYIRSALIAAEEEVIDKDSIKKIIKLKNKILKIHNTLLRQRKQILTDEQITNPYILDDKLERSARQPKFVKDLQHEEYDLHQYQGDFYDMQRMMIGCRGYSRQTQPALRCKQVHHMDPYVMMGPFKIEVASKEPLIVVFHEILTEEDSEHFLELAKPKLSRKRGYNTDSAYSRREREEGKVKVIYKSVQAWLDTIEFAGMEGGKYTPNNFTILDRRAENLSSRLEKALNLNVTNQWSSHKYQVTNYGLAGLCEVHVDPHGYLEGADMTGKDHLMNTGDYIGTVMAWLEDTPAGGATTFYEHKTEVSLWPTRGAAAFWFSLYRDGVRDPAASHGGCPVAVGSKWILNKWVYSFNNWDKQPCSTHYTNKYDYQHKDRITWSDSSYY